MLDALTNSDWLNVGLHVSLATVVFVLGLVLLAIAFRRIYRKIEAWQERRPQALRSAGKPRRFHRYLQAQRLHG